MLRLVKVLLMIILLLALSLTAGYGYLQHKLNSLAITNFDYDISKISLNHIQLKQLSFTLQQPELVVQLQHLTISWQWHKFFVPSLNAVLLVQGQVTLKQWPIASETSDNSFILPQQWKIPDFIPNKVDINNLQLTLPCANQQCTYIVNTELTKMEQQVDYHLQLADISAPDISRATLSGNLNALYDLPELNIKLNIDDTIKLTLQQQFSQTVDQLSADSEISLNANPLSPWLLQQLEQWQIVMSKPAIEQFTAPINITSQAKLLLPLPLNQQNMLQQLSGDWQLSANLPTELSIPNIGLLQGDITGQLSLVQGKIANYQLQSALILKQAKFISPFQQYGIDIESIMFDMHADGSAEPHLEALPLVLTVKTLGPTKTEFNTNLIINASDNFRVQLNNAKLSLQQPNLQYQLADNQKINLEKLTVYSDFSAAYHATGWQLDIAHFMANAANIKFDDISAEQVKLSLQPSQFTSEENLTINSSVILDIATLKQPELVAQRWQYHANIAGNINNLSLKGRLENAANLAVEHQVAYQQQTINVNWQLDDIFLLGGNPLATSFKQWPALLEFNRGRILANGSVNFSQNQPLVIANIKLNELSGIYDSSMFQALTADIRLDYTADKANIDVQQAELVEFSQGVKLGPAKFSANYTADSNNLMAGILDLQQLDIVAMGGHVTVEPRQLDFTKRLQIIRFTLAHIDLAQILQQHPSSDLKGKGRISGIIPLLISQDGISVDKGQIAAESPGGELQYRPPAAGGMAAGNQSMKMVLEALDDFHYTVLSSNVSYDTTGKLILGLTIQGNNPALEQGRAVNLNINLEEDIPALLTSMQLSSEISDKIKQRIQQRLQNKAVKASNGESP